MTQPLGEHLEQTRPIGIFCTASSTPPNAPGMICKNNRKFTSSLMIAVVGDRSRLMLVEVKKHDGRRLGRGQVVVDVVEGRW